MPESRKRDTKARWGTRQRQRANEVTASEKAKNGLTRTQIIILVTVALAFIAAIAYFATRPKTIETASGLKYEVLEKGTTGKKPVKGQTIQVNYTGTLKKTGEKFDSSYDGGQPYEFKLGEGAVIKGWDEALADMQVGERRRLTIPPKLAYGANGQPPKIPANATLVFDVKLENIKE